MQQIIHIAAHPPRPDDLRNIFDSLMKFAQPRGGVVAGFHGNENRNRQAELVGVQHRDAGFDDAGFLHALDALPAGRGGKPHLVGDFVERERGIRRQQAQDGTVDLVQLGHGLATSLSKAAAWGQKPGCMKSTCGAGKIEVEASSGHAPPPGRFSSVREMFYGRFFSSRQACAASAEP